MYMYTCLYKNPEWKVRAFLGKFRFVGVSTLGFLGCRIGISLHLSMDDISLSLSQAT